MLRKIFSIGIVLMLVFELGCSNLNHSPTTNKSFKSTGVTIINRGNYFDTVLDFDSGLTHSQIGEAFAKGILELVPEYESLVDSYIAENLNQESYENVLSVVKDLKPQLQKDYLDEIEGMANVFSGGDKNIRKDNKISREEFFLFNLFPDAARGTQCSFVSVFGSRSSTHGTIAGRNLDWYGGSKNQLPRIQAIITLKNSKRKVCSIGFLGFMGIITGINDGKIFAAILDAQTYEAFSSKNKRSYPFDLRYALENKASMDNVAEFMKSNSADYTVNHIIALADTKVSKILENNFSGKGPEGQSVQSSLRSSDSKLNKGITWGISDSIGCVNSFLLEGNFDNHNYFLYNTERWNNMKEKLLSKGPSLTSDALKDVITYNHGTPGAFSDSGDLYNKMTLHMVVFEPENLSLEVYFRPKGIRKNPVKPIFEKIKIFNN